MCHFCCCSACGAPLPCHILPEVAGHGSKMKWEPTNSM
jgi:hypothetical protein